MKTAKFVYEESGIKVFGVIILKNGNKVKISLDNSSKYSSYMRMKAKNLAKEIVDLNFNHSSVYEIIEVSEDTFAESKRVLCTSLLINELYAHTKELKEVYVEEIKRWADNKYNMCLDRSVWGDKEWYDYYGLVYKMYKDGSGNEFPLLEHGYNFNVYSIMLSARNEVSKILGMGLDKYKLGEVRLAEIHYEASIIKLAGRLNEKGVTDKTKFEIESGRIGINFECLIRHEFGITKAWTIIAEGEVNRPHYRYLVK